METFDSEYMRLSPLGTDEGGNIYWFFKDFKLNMLLYREEPDDDTGDTFTLLAQLVLEKIKIKT